MPNNNYINSGPNSNSMWNTNPFYPNPNNFYSNNYLNRNNNNYIPSQQSSMQQQQQVYQNNIIWVKGKENARSMQLPPNSTVILLDSEVGKFYIKTTDDIGLGKLRVFSYIEEPDNDSSTNSSSVPNVDLSNYVTKAELEQIVKEIKQKENESIISTIKSNTKKQQSKTVNKQF